MFDSYNRGGKGGFPSAQKRTGMGSAYLSQNRQGVRSRQRHNHRNSGNSAASFSLPSSPISSGTSGFLPSTGRQADAASAQQQAILRRREPNSRGRPRGIGSMAALAGNMTMNVGRSISNQPGNNFLSASNGTPSRRYRGAPGASQSMSSSSASSRRKQSGALPQISGGGHDASGGNAQTIPRRRNPPGGHHHPPAVLNFEKGFHSGACTIEGVKPGNPNWSNQDNLLIFENVNGDATLHTWAVFDGHGESGHHVSKYCRDRMGKVWVEQNQNFQRTFKKMQTEFENSAVDARCSGATCVMAVLRGSSLLMANCGDSRGVLGRRANGQVSTVLLTSDHKPDRPDERRRIMASGGQVGSRQLVVGHNANGPVTVPLGPPRVWYHNRGETMGLAMSRSLGDVVVHGCGVSAEPEISEHAVSSNDLFLILATDGIWDVIDSNQAVQIVAGHLSRATAHAGAGAKWDVSDAATTLASTARKRWESLSPMVDDITAIVVDLRHLQQQAV